MIVKEIQKKFESLFGTEPLYYRSPGIVNFLGAHTDYNNGFTLSANVNMEMVFAVTINNTDKAIVHSMDLDDQIEFNVDLIEKSDKAWANYILGMVSEFRKKGKIIGGFNCVFSSDIPIGSGMAASTSVKCGVGYFLNRIFDLGLSPQEIAEIATVVENEYIGVGSGIRDQFNNLFARTSHLLKLDCQTLNYEFIETDFSNFRFVIFDSQVKSNRRNKLFEKRKNECEKGLEIVRKYFPEVKSLRDCTMDMLLKCKTELTPILFRRCSFIVNENNRVKTGFEDLKKNRIESFGALLNQSQLELKVDFEVSCEEIDFLITEVGKSRDVIGARMIGAGAGGCTLNMIKDYDREEYIKDIQKKFKKKFRKDLLVYKLKIVRGTSQIN